MTLSSLVPATSTYLVNNKVTVNLLAVRLQITDDWADLLGGAESDTTVKEEVTWAIDLEGWGMIALWKGKRTAFPDRTAGEGQKWWCIVAFWPWARNPLIPAGSLMLSQFSSTFYFRRTELLGQQYGVPLCTPIYSHIWHGTFVTISNIDGLFYREYIIINY